jgi:hypothetical protein
VQIGRRKGVRVRYVNEPWDFAVDVRAVLVVALPFFCMLLASTQQAHDERQARLEIERTVVEDVRTMRAKIDALQSAFDAKEIELARERARLTYEGGISGYTDRETYVAASE